MNSLYFQTTFRQEYEILWKHDTVAKVLKYPSPPQYGNFYLCMSPKHRNPTFRLVSDRPYFIAAAISLICSAISVNVLLRLIKLL